MAKAQSGPYEQVDFDTAEDLLAELLPHSGEHLGRPQEESWLYRGQLDAEWGLQPAVMRKGNHYRYAPGQVVIPTTTVGDRLTSEYRMMIAFAALADNHGFALPHDSVEFRIEEHPEDSPYKFPPTQHRGIYANKVRAF